MSSVTQIRSNANVLTAKTLAICSEQLANDVYTKLSQRFPAESVQAHMEKLGVIEHVRPKASIAVSDDVDPASSANVNISPKLGR